MQIQRLISSCVYFKRYKNIIAQQSLNVNVKISRVTNKLLHQITFNVQWKLTVWEELPFTDRVACRGLETTEGSVEMNCFRLTDSITLLRTIAAFKLFLVSQLCLNNVLNINDHLWASINKLSLTLG